MIYTLSDFNNAIFNGFDYKLPEETLKKISELSLEVGSPSYVKTPVFNKRENISKIETSNSRDVINGSVNTLKKRKGNKNMEINEEWDSIRTFQTTKIEQKSGVDGQIDIIRAYLNKLSDKNFSDIQIKVMSVLDTIICETVDDNDLTRLSTFIFDIASDNRFYSKLYADMYCNIIRKYEVMKTPFEESLSTFIELFNVIEYIDPAVDYIKFCNINKNNEKRKSLAAFFMNLMLNNVISPAKIVLITRNLLEQIYTFISQDNKKNEVDELSENVAILFKKELYDESDESEDYDEIDGLTIMEVIEKIANSKVKDYKSLTNKTVFKFMDMIDM